MNRSFLWAACLLAASLFSGPARAQVAGYPYPYYPQGQYVPYGYPACPGYWTMPVPQAPAMTMPVPQAPAMNLAAFQAEVPAAKPDNPMERIARLEAEVADLRSQVGGDCHKDNPCPGHGFIGGAEVVWVKPHHSSGIGVPPLAATDLGFEFESTLRSWLGYVSKSGLGIRATYWEFDHTTSELFAAFNAFVSYDVYVWDLELTETLPLGTNWQATLSGGFRYVDFTESRGRIAPATGALLGGGSRFASTSHGGTMAAELYRRHGNFSLFFGARGSVLFGDEDEFAVVGGNFRVIDQERDNVKFIWEARLGAEWDRELARGGLLFVRGSYEFQYWNNFSGEPPNFDGGEAIGFHGLGLAVGVRR